MVSPAPRVAIVLLSFHSEPYIQDVVSSLRKLSYPKDRLALVIVDNPHPEHGSSIRFLQEQILPLAGHDLPEVILLPQSKNLGFSGGCNAGIEWAVKHGFDYVFLHNQDGFLARNAIEKLVETLESDKTIGAAQCLLLLYPETELVNSAGNAFHYLGLGYCQSFRAPKSQLHSSQVASVGYASGAALMLRGDLLRIHGGLDDPFFLYHEDLSYGLRMRSLGYRNVVVPEAVYYHKYQFSRSQLKFFYIERNRLGAMLIYFKPATLLLLFPMGMVLELGLLGFALKEGWIKEKLRAYAYWLQPKNWQPWLTLRRRIQSTRTEPDRAILKEAVSEIHFQEKQIDNVVLRRIGNPLMSLYWKVVKPLIRW